LPGRPDELLGRLERALGRRQVEQPSNTACTTVPRVAAREGASGNRSIVRNRYSSGQVLKSDARDGDSDPTIASGKAATVSVMPETLEPSPDNFWQARLYLSRAGAGVGPIPKS